VTNYVSAVPLKELGLGLGVEHLGDEQAQELTDDYSLPALKVRPLAGRRQVTRAAPICSSNHRRGGEGAQAASSSLLMMLYTCYFTF